MDDLAASIISLVLIFGVVIGIRLIYAKFIYNDMRCVFAECRINVSP